MGKKNLDKVNLILKDTKAIKSIEVVYRELVNAITCSIEDGAIDFEDYDEIEPICQFIQIEPDALSGNFIKSTGKLIQEQAEYIFDWPVSQADDEIDIRNLRESVERFEAVFNIDLQVVNEMIDGQEENIQERFDELPDDWGESKEGSFPDATDEDIFSMFGSLYD